MKHGTCSAPIATLDKAGVKGTLVDLPAAQTLEFTEETTTQELRGDDSVIAQRTTVDNVSWTLESGGISFEAYTVIAGGVVSSSGVTPNVVKKWRRMGTDSYPDFFLEGQSMSESDGDHNLVIHRAKASQISGTLGDQEFWVSHAEGTGIATLTAANVGAVWDMVANETVTAIT